MGKTVKGLLGSVGLGGSAPKADAAPATQEVKTEADDAKKARQALLETQGGIAGEELSPDEVKRRETIFGN